MSRIKLKTHAGETDIRVPGKLQNLSSYINEAENLHMERIVLLVDENVLKHHGGKLDGFKILSTRQGEQSKSLDNYGKIFGQLLDMGVDRGWTLIGVGGGVTTDLAGFVASTYFRGISFGFVSTSLLGQVDAAIGGKNGINYEGYKNLIGTIRQPEFVWCDDESLKTLPEKEFRGGFSEIIKYAFINRPDLYDYLQNHISSAMKYDEEALVYLISESVKSKVEIVSRDSHERGDRKLLNLGHTFGHALEKLHGISHGEAVSAGMVMASRASANLGFTSQDTTDKLLALLHEAGLPDSFSFDPDAMSDTMMKDKKRKGDTMEFILLRGVGQAFIHSVKLEDIKPMLYDLR